MHFRCCFCRTFRGCHYPHGIDLTNLGRSLKGRHQEKPWNVLRAQITEAFKHSLFTCVGTWNVYVDPVAIAGGRIEVDKLGS